MKHLFTPFCTAAVLIGTLLATSSCNQKCGLAETGPPLLGFAFSTDTLAAGKGFRKAEAFSAYLVRYKNADLTQPLDTVRTTQRPGNFYYVDRTLFCNFPASAGPSDPHSYRLEVPGAARRYDITDIGLQYDAVGSCSNTISRLDALVNGQRVDARRGFVLTK